ncbi:hypothetical protein H0H92_003449 [Tricholoma furcatifolium]|nr:hypothetical protein H0H92_003449 [Tricholoma furcatifolium]
MLSDSPSGLSPFPPMALSHVSSLLYLLSFLTVARSTPVERIHSARDATTAVFSTTLGGKTYVNQGIVGFGLIPSDFRDSTGETFGGVGSAIDLKFNSFRRVSNTSFAGTLVVEPDRGYNANGTIDYQNRQHNVDFVLTPYYGTDDLDFATAQQTFNITYRNTILRYERFGHKTSGLDPAAIRAQDLLYPLIPLADPQMPIASLKEPHLTLDTEGLVANADGTFWVSDEYGPYIYLYSANGNLIETIQPPAAVLPHDSTGKLNFTANVDPATGRAANQGFEGLTLDRINKVLYVMLQSATIQDGGADSIYTRLFAYDVKDPLIRPPLIGEWVVPLPISSKGKVEACSEIHFVTPGVFLALSRDGDGNGGNGAKSSYKQADLFSIANATDIHGTLFDNPAYPVSPNGTLNSTIIPAEYVSFVNYIDDTQLARFGLHNGKPIDETLIDGKWESLTLASVDESENPDDFFLFTASDNDFLTENGFTVGMPYNASLNVDTQFLVWRLTLPGASKYHSNGLS